MKRTKETEKLIERKLVDRVKEMGGWPIKLLPFTVSGLPDRLCLFSGGRILFAELKGPGLKPTPLQLAVHAKLKRLGFRVEVIDSIKLLNTILKDYDSNT